MQSYAANQIVQFIPELPQRFRSNYQLGGYEQERIVEVMWKYLLREANCRRAWVRTHTHLPEIFHSDATLDVLEFSTAHGAMLEIIKALGHRAKGTDFNWRAGLKPRRPKKYRPWQNKLLEDLQSKKSEHTKGPALDGWAYQPIIESLGLDVDIFDAKYYPYSYEDDSFDIVLCYQAIDAYAAPEKWIEIVDEFCRIARDKVVIGFNPLPSKYDEDEEVQNQLKSAWSNLIRAEIRGFTPVFFEFGHTKRGNHPTAIKFQKKR